MLAQTEMFVVIVMMEKITSWMRENSLRQKCNLSFNMVILIKCHSDETFRNERVKRGKLCKLATQNLVGALR